MKLILKSINYESERGADLFLFFFGDHPNFGQYNTSSGVIYVGFPSFHPDFEIFKHFLVPNRACILAVE